MQEYVIHYADLAAKYLQFLDDRLSIRAQTAAMRSYKETIGSKWSGCTCEEMATWIQQGYRIPGLVLEPHLKPVRERRRMRMNDMDGEFQYDLWRSGEDNFFVDFTQRETVPAIRYQVVTGFASSTSESIVAEYSSWVLKSIIALEESGIDCEISIAGDWEDRSSGRQKLQPFKWRVIVKRSGEALDIAAWSPILSPGGFRHLIFLVYMLSAEHCNFSMRTDFGWSKERTQFAVSLDEETSTIIAEPKRTATSFDEASMTEQFQAAINRAKEIT